MPSTIAAIFIFVVGIAPGFLLLRGYQRARTYVEPPLNLYAVTQAVVLSALILLITFPVFGWVVLRWTRHHTLLDGIHPWALWVALTLLLTVPYYIGLATGRFVDAVTAPGEPDLPAPLQGRWRGRLLSALRRRVHDSRFSETAAWLGLGRSPTVWDRLWEDIAAADKPVMIEVDLGDGEFVTGVFARDSRVTTSPDPRQIFLEAEYVESEEDGNRLLHKREHSKGVFIDATSIKDIRILEHVQIEQ